MNQTEPKHLRIVCSADRYSHDLPERPPKEISDLIEATMQRPGEDYLVASEIFDALDYKRFNEGRSIDWLDLITTMYSAGVIAGRKGV